MYFYWVAGLVLALAWASRVVEAALGMRRVADLTAHEWDRRDSAAFVTVIVPARNEHESIERTLTSLLQQDYSNHEVIAVDDRSTDGTGEIMDRVATGPEAERLKVIHISTLPSAWMGKSHAMWKAAQQARGEWLLFTDADITFRADCVRRAVAYAETSKADHVVLFPTLIMASVGVRMMLAFFQMLFVFGHRPWKVADPDSRDHMGIGAFNLVRRSVYEQVGTHHRLKFEVLDDVKLGKIVKESGFAQRNVMGRDLITLHWAKNVMGIVQNFSKNFFALMQFRWKRALGACLALAFLNWMPFVGVWLAPGWSRALYVIALVSIFLLYAEFVKSPLYFFLHPVATLLFMYTLLRSMTLTLWRGGVVWRGTFYPLEELRRGLV